MGRPKGSKNKPKPVTVDAPPPSKLPPKKTAARVDIDPYQQARLEEESDMLHIPPEIIPDGMRYNWKTLSVLGQQQLRRFGRFQTTGWTPVPASRHPGLFTPKGFDGPIEYDGLVLMEKPEELCKQTEAREFMKARSQVAGKEAQLRGGDIDGVAFDTKHKSAMRVNKLSKTYEKFEVPE